MKIVICGAGKIGETLCYQLEDENHDIVLIDANESRMENLINNADITGICGNATLYDTQHDAGVDTCDVFIAVMPSDESNLIASITAKALGAKWIIARVRDPEYTKQLEFFHNKLGIDFIINPELETARDLVRMIQFPQAISVEHFHRGKINIVSINVDEGGILDGLSLIDFRRQFPQILVCIINRNNDVIIPKGHDVLTANDNIYLTGELTALNKLFSTIDHRNKRIRSVLIVGAGRITRYMIPRLLRSSGIHIKVIENNPERCRLIAGEFPKVEVINGDGTDQKILVEERAPQHDALIGLTGIDEENIILAIYGNRNNLKKTIAKVNRINLLRVLDLENKLSTVAPHQIITDKIIRFVRSMKDSEHANMENLYRLAEGRVEMIQFRANEDCQVLDKPLKDLRLHPNTLVVLIARGEEFIAPTGNDVIVSGDTVLVVTTSHGFSQLDDILA